MDNTNNIPKTDYSHMSFFQELKRRNVFRVGIAYVLAAWILLQIVDFATQVIEAPGWILQIFVVVAALGLPIVLIFAWVFEMTPEGIKRETDIDRSESVNPHTSQKLGRLIFIFMALAVVFLLADKFFLNPGQTSGADPVAVSSTVLEPVSIEAETTDANEKSIAVLPFVNMSDDQQNEYFSDGISEELLNVLVRVEGLRVPSRTSSFTFKGSEKKLSEIGRELQVDHVLEGSVRKSGNRIRITAQLIDVKTDTHLWSDSYTRELDDIFAVQDEVAKAIVEALKVTLTGEQQQNLTRRSTENVEAYNHFLEGRHLWNTRSQQGLVGSVTALRKAVEIDPGFTDAWAALADAYVLLPEYGLGSIEQYIPLARDAVSRTLQLNPKSARGLTTSGYIKYLYEYDLPGGKLDFLKAIEIEPGYATAHHWYGEALSVERKTDDALEQFRIAAELDPLAPIILHTAGWVCEMAGRLEESVTYYERALAINPQFEPTLSNSASAYALLGEYDLGREKSRLYSDLTGLDQSAFQNVIDALENPVLKPEAMAAIDGHPIKNGTLEKASLYILLDEPELALDALEASFAAGDPYAPFVNQMVIFDSLRDNPRFQAHLAKMNFLPLD